MSESSDFLGVALSLDQSYSVMEPIGPIGIIAHQANQSFVEQINQKLYERRFARVEKNHAHYVHELGYLRKDYQISSQIIRFSSGEGKVTLEQSIRGHDIYIISDVLSHHVCFSVSGQAHCYSPDDHYRDLLRIIMAVSGKAKRINIIMPFLYEGRQDVRHARESLDCASMLKQLYGEGVSNIIIFDPHDERVVNAVPLMGIEMPKSAYKIISTLISINPSLSIRPDKMLVVSPDESGVSRAVYYSSVLGLPLGIFYRRYDYVKKIDGAHPVRDLCFMGDSCENKDVLIVDDMINSGRTMTETAKRLKDRGANDIYCVAPFGLFTEGIERMQSYVNQGIIRQVLCTNLIYRRPELLKADWYVDVNMTPFVARLIDAINLDESLGKLINPGYKIQDLLGQIRIGEVL